jgi:branched-chain amino acid transport system ATP-binding protein
MPSREQTGRRLALEALELAGLSHLAGQAIDAVEGPTQKVVELARCLAGKPRILLLDELASGTSQSEKAALADRIRRIHEELGITVLLVEHDLDFVTSLADRIVVLDAGAVLADGQPSTVFADKTVVEAYLGV